MWHVWYSAVFIVGGDVAEAVDVTVPAISSVLLVSLITVNKREKKEVMYQSSIINN